MQHTGGSCCYGMQHRLKSRHVLRAQAATTGLWGKGKRTCPSKRRFATAHVLTPFSAMSGQQAGKLLAALGRLRWRPSFQAKGMGICKLPDNPASCLPCCPPMSAKQDETPAPFLRSAVQRPRAQTSEPVAHLRAYVYAPDAAWLVGTLARVFPWLQMHCAVT